MEIQLIDPTLAQVGALNRDAGEKGWIHSFQQQVV